MAKIFQIQTGGIYQLKISLADSKPMIWRRILIPSDFTFRDLHNAIQDCMDWLDYHLYVFRVKNPLTKAKVDIGKPSPDDLMFGIKILPDTKVEISRYLSENNTTAEYEYDFGDSWLHAIKLEKILAASPGEKYPKCIAGKMACPPEDSGGIPGYYNLLSIMKDPKHEEHKEVLGWMGKDFDPDYFNPDDVVFTETRKKSKKKK